MHARSPLIIGTRGSKLALAQTAMVRAELARIQPDLETEVVRITTTGDRIQDRPLAEVGGKALFVTEIETALREGRIHLAVHSAKDIPSDLPADMQIAACLPRADARDVLVSRVSADFAGLPAGARVGTSSPRRACQLRALRPDLDLRDIRGNVDTRLAKLERGEFDAIVLAAAGLNRLDLLHHATQFMPLSAMLPCAAQGAIAIEVCSADAATLAVVAHLDHAPTSVAVVAERAFLSTVGGTCSTPLAAHAVLENGDLVLAAMIGDASGRTVTGTVAGQPVEAAALGVRLAEQLLAAGGADLLRSQPDLLATSNAVTYG